VGLEGLEPSASALSGQQESLYDQVLHHSCHNYATKLTLVKCTVCAGVGTTATPLPPSS